MRLGSPQWDVHRLKAHLESLYHQELGRQLQERASSAQDDLAGACLEIVCTQGQPAAKSFVHMDVAFSFTLKAKALPKSTSGKADREKATAAAAKAAAAAAKPASLAPAAEKRKSKGWFNS